MFIENYAKFEELIRLNLCDDNATITGSEIIARRGSTILRVFYTVPGGYAAKYDLAHTSRVLEIVLKRGENDHSLPIISYANGGEVF